MFVLRMLGGCLARLFVLALLAGGAFAAWHYRDALAGGWRGWLDTPAALPAAPTPELAEAAESKLVALGQGHAGDQISLAGLELQSLLTYRLSPLLPASVREPAVAIDGDRLRFRARVPTDALPGVRELGGVAKLLPDTMDVVAVGQFMPLRGDRVGLAIDRLTTARVPLPRHLIPGILSELGRREEPGLPADALAVPLPPGVDAAYIRGDSAVFLARGATSTNG